MISKYKLVNQISLVEVGLCLIDFDPLINYLIWTFKNMISSVVFINIKGEILIYRSFKDDITRA